MFLRSYFSISQNQTEMICNNGKCNGKILKSHVGNLERHLKVVHSDIYTKYAEKKFSLTEPYTKGNIFIFHFLVPSV